MVQTAEREALFTADRADKLRARWAEVQGGFVDDPKKSVKAADQLVDEVVGDLTKLFADERARLEKQLGESERVSTEDLRIALRRYRSFFERLLGV